MRLNFNKSVFSALLLSSLVLSACGGGSSGGGGGGQSTSVSGSVTKGPVTNATVQCYQIDANSGQLSLLATTQTNAVGEYSLGLGNASGPFLLAVGGGRFVDESTGATVTLAPSGTLTNLRNARQRSLSALLASGASGSLTCHINPMTTIATGRVSQVLSTTPSVLDASDLEAVHKVVGIEFGLAASDDPRFIQAADLTSSQTGSTTADTPEAILGLFNASLSQLASNISNSSRVGAIDPLDLIDALVSDFADGTLNAVTLEQGQGAAIGLGQGQLLGSDLTTGLATAAGQFLNSSANASGFSAGQFNAPLATYQSLSQSVTPMVNSAPIFTVPAGPTFTAGGLRTVQLTGLSAGQLSIDQNQTLSVTASSSATGVVQISSVSSVSQGQASVSLLALNAGTATLTLTVQDSGGTANNGVDQFRAELLVTILPALEVTTSTLLNPIAGLNYADSLQAQGGSQAGFSWSVTPSLPSGLSLNPQTGEITGQPVSTSNQSYSFTVTDSLGFSASRSLNITVEANDPIVYSGSSQFRIRAGKPISEALTAQGGRAPISFSVQSGSALPQGLSLSTNGSITGTATESGSISTVVVLTDVFQNTQTATIQWQISRPWIAYLADQDIDGDEELYAYDPAQNLTFKVNGTLPTGAEVDSNPVSDEVWSPDGKYLVYIADQDTLGALEIYLVDMSQATPGTPVKLNPSLPLGSAGVVDFRWSPDSRYLAFRGDCTVPAAIDLYVVDVSGATPGTAQRVSNNAVAGRDVEKILSIGTGEGYSFAPNSQFLVYQADQDVDDVLELYFVDISGTTPATGVKLNAALMTGQNCESFTISRDSSMICYCADETTMGVKELYLVEVNNNAPGQKTKVNGALTAGGSCETDVFEDLLAPGNGYGFAPNNQALVYRADQDSVGQIEIYWVDLSQASPGTPVKVNSTLVDTAADVNSFQFAPNSMSLVYNADQDVSGADELYFVPIANNSPGTPVKVNAPLTSAGDCRTFSNGNGYNYSPDSSRIAFLADISLDNVNELFLVTISGSSLSTPVKVNTPLSNTTTDINSFFFSADSSRLIYVGDEQTAGADELFQVDVSQSMLVAEKLSSTLVSGGDVQISFAGISYGPGADYVAYRADQDVDGDIELYVVPLFGNMVPVKANGMLVAGGDVRNFKWTPQN